MGFQLKPRLTPNVTAHGVRIKPRLGPSIHPPRLSISTAIHAPKAAIGVSKGKVRSPKPPKVKMMGGAASGMALSRTKTKPAKAQASTSTAPPKSQSAQRPGVGQRPPPVKFHTRAPRLGPSGYVKGQFNRPHISPSKVRHPLKLY